MFQSQSLQNSSNEQKVLFVGDWSGWVWLSIGYVYPRSTMGLTQLIMMNYERDCCTVRPYLNWHSDTGEQRRRFGQGCFIWALVERVPSFFNAQMGWIA